MFFSPSETSCPCKQQLKDPEFDTYFELLYTTIPSAAEASQR